tara:strand:+ start:3160 stop:4230 length:1071 start_codon:yes stop_codon:yes gene_type:complete
MNTHLSIQGSTVIIGNESIDVLNDIITKLSISDIYILLDQNSRLYCLDHLLVTIPCLRNSKIIELPHGESSKSLATLELIILKMLSNNIDRDCLILNLGGGVVSDFGGFLASVLKRGVKFINIPTTLMAQVDAAIGGKVGLNVKQYKNQIGAFNQPHAILINPAYLKTLNQINILSGLAEVLKYALINNRTLWNNLKGKIFNNQFDFNAIIINCVKAKIDIVNNDIYDWKDRRKLNFGHSIGHAIESLSLAKKTPISHGLGVAIGMICESYVSYHIFNFNKSILDEITSILLHYFPKYNISKNDDKIIMNYLLNDKKNSNDSVNFTLIKNIGISEINCNVSKELILKSIDYYRDNV